MSMFMYLLRFNRYILPWIKLLKVKGNINVQWMWKSTWVLPLLEKNYCRIFFWLQFKSELFYHFNDCLDSIPKYRWLSVLSLFLSVLFCVLTDAAILRLLINILKKSELWFMSINIYKNTWSIKFINRNKNI